MKPQWKAYDDVFRGRTNAAGLEGTLLILWRWELFSGGKMSRNDCNQAKRRKEGKEMERARERERKREKKKLDSASSSEAIN